MNNKTTHVLEAEIKQTIMDKILDILPEGLLLLNEECYIVFINATLEEKFSILKDEVLGRKFSELFNLNLDILIPLVNQVIKYRVKEETVANIGQKKFKITLAPFEHEDIRYCLLIFHDISEIESIKRKLIQNERLISIGKLASGISHEINNPLDAVIRYVNLALGYCEDEEIIKGYLLSAREGLDRIASIIEALQEFSWHAKYNPQKLINIRTALEGALSILESKIKAKKIKIVKKYNRMLPFVIDGGLELVFTNIIKNAIDAVDSNGVIEITVRTQNGEVEIKIKDNGCGIPKDILHKIYDPFFTTKRAGEGTGLGLSICREIIEKSNGSIEINSEINKGTEVILRFPTA